MSIKNRQSGEYHRRQCRHTFNAQQGISDSAEADRRQHDGVATTSPIAVELPRGFQRERERDAFS
jgi:hypothetical protein